MTILPLPAIDSVTPESATMLLTPFDAVRRWLDGCSFVLTDFSTYKDTFTNPDFLQIVFNILLLLPFGVYLRYYFNRRWYQVLLLSFLYSLFFECTQLSGLYGIYPYPFHAVGIGRRVEVVAPEKRRVRCREYRMAVSGEDTVVGIGWHIFACQELLVLQLQPVHRFLKVGHCRKLSLYCLLLKGVGCIGRE